MLLTGLVCLDPVIFSSHIYVVIICSFINTSNIICVKLKFVPVFFGLFLSVLAFNLFRWSVSKFVICNVLCLDLSSRLILIAIIGPIETGCGREWEWDRVANESASLSLFCYCAVRSSFIFHWVAMIAFVICGMTLFSSNLTYFCFQKGLYFMNKNVYASHLCSH
jgi:hypothetical protein